jgi:hypothetical protein
VVLWVPESAAEPVGVRPFVDPAVAFSNSQTIVENQVLFRAYGKFQINCRFWFQNQFGVPNYGILMR